MNDFSLSFLPKPPENVQVTRDGMVLADEIVTGDDFEPYPFAPGSPLQSPQEN